MTSDHYVMLLDMLDICIVMFKTLIDTQHTKLSNSLVGNLNTVKACFFFKVLSLNLYGNY